MKRNPTSSFLRRSWLRSVALIAIVGAGSAGAAEEEVQKFCRFRSGDQAYFGIVEGENVRAISAAPWKAWEKSEQVFALSDVQLLVPTRPSQVRSEERRVG